MELIKKLKEKISIAFDNNCNVYDTDWGSQQGILITVKDAMLIVKHLETAQLQQHSVMPVCQCNFNRMIVRHDNADYCNSCKKLIRQPSVASEWQVKSKKTSTKRIV